MTFFGGKTHFMGEKLFCLYALFAICHVTKNTYLFDCLGPKTARTVLDGQCLSYSANCHAVRGSMHTFDGI